MTACQWQASFLRHPIYLPVSRRWGLRRSYKSMNSSQKSQSAGISLYLLCNSQPFAIVRSAPDNGRARLLKAEAISYQDSRREYKREYKRTSAVNLVDWKSSCDTQNIYRCASGFPSWKVTPNIDSHSASSTHGELRLDEFVVKPPLYAILSHTRCNLRKRFSSKPFIPRKPGICKTSKRSKVAVRQLLLMVSSTSGLIPAVSTKQPVQSSRRLLIQYISSTKILRSVWHTCQLYTRQRIRPTSGLSLQKADCSREVRLCKN